MSQSSTNVGSMKFSPGLKNAFTAFAAVGAVAIIAGILKDPERAWPNFLVNYFFFFAIGLFGAFFTALQHITNAYWSVTVRRLAEGLMSYLPIAFVLAFVLYFGGAGRMYEWMHHDVVKHDTLLTMKAPYLNPKFFFIRLLIYFGIWIGLGWKMRRNSLAQDSTGAEQLTIKNIKLSTAFLPLFAFSFTLMSFDLLMSLEPHWYSTIYGVYCFAGLWVTGFCALSLLTVYGRKQGVISDKLINPNHLHDLGKWMFAFTVFWAYIFFAQVMLQWYANIPEETAYYLRRFEGGWWPFFWFVLFVNFIIPFMLFLPREAKRKEKYLVGMAIFLLAAHWFDVYFLVMPVFFKNGPVFGWIEIGTLLGFLGAFGLSVMRFLEKVPAVPVRDPRLAACLAHEQ